MNIKNGALIILAGVVAFAAHYAFLVFSGSISYKDMDLNQDGFVSYAEALKFFDTGTRPIIVDGKACTEYYALKDGLSVQFVCEHHHP